MSDAPTPAPTPVPPAPAPQQEAPPYADPAFLKEVDGWLADPSSAPKAVEPVLEDLREAVSMQKQLQERLTELQKVVTDAQAEALRIAGRTQSLLQLAHRWTTAQDKPAS